MPVLREDLLIRPSAPSPTGEPAWTIYDPLRHRFVQINGETRRLLSGWQAGITAQELCDRARVHHGSFARPGDIARLASFLARHYLTVDGSADWRDLERRANADRPGPLARLLHGYLFFRVPLFDPQRLLHATYPFVSWVYTRWAAALILFAGAVGLYLAARQWSSFIAAAGDIVSVQNFAMFALALIVVKALHELAHAYTAYRYGCRVPVIGVAFVLGAPLLYTDVTDAWRLTSRRQRLAIDAAGIAVELAIACLATLVWVFLPDGPMRAMTFALATTAWIVSLLVNLNPFMRFDGYYLLADVLAVDNLQPRAFELGTWQMRRLLFAPGLPPPEPLQAAARLWLVVYAWAVWLYRLVLFTSIAVLVYTMFFKVLGIMLFLVEIVLLVLRPIWRELAQWRRVARAYGCSRRMVLSATIAAAAAALLAMPISSIVIVPAVMEAVSSQQVFAPRPGLVEHVAVTPGGAVAQGAMIVRLVSPEIDHELRLTAIRIELAERRLARTGADVPDREETLVLTQRVEALRARHAGLVAERDELVVRAPIDGAVLERTAELHGGRWIGRNELLAFIGDARGRIVRGYLAGDDVERIGQQAKGSFVPDDRTLPKIDVTLASIARAGAPSIEIAELASGHGGPIATEPDERQQPVPRQAQYLVEFEPAPGAASSALSVRGVVRLAARPESLLAGIARQIMKVLIRESGT